MTKAEEVIVQVFGLYVIFHQFRQALAEAGAPQIVGAQAFMTDSP